MRSFARRILCFSLLCATLAALLPSLPSLTAYAAVSESSLSEVDPRVLTSCLDAMADDFNRATVDWTVEGATAEAVTALTEKPYSVYEGSRSLLVSSPSYEAGDRISLTREVSSELSADLYTYYAATVWVPESAGQATLSLTLRSRRGTFTASAIVATGRWQTVFFDLGDAEIEGALRSVTLTLESSEDGPLSFLLDCVGGSSTANAAFTARYLAPVYEASGCSLTSADALTVRLSGQGQYLESAPVLTDFSGGVGIRVRLRNRSDCSSLTLRYTTLGSAEYTDDRAITVAIPEGEDIVSCLFAIPASYIGSFRLAFDGAPSGEVEILSVTAAPCYTAAASLGKLTDCSITRDKKNLQIRGTLSEAMASLYAGCSVYLYALPLWEDITAVTPSSPVLAETALNGREISFTVPLTGSGNELYQKYAVMIYSAGALLPVGSPRVVNDPESLASYKTAVTPDSIKGYYAAEGNYLFDGLSQTALEVRLDRLICLTEENTLLHTVSDTSCFIDLSYLNELDAAMQEYERQGLAVRLLLRLQRPDDLTLAELLCHPLSDGGTYVAFNTASEEGIELLRLACDFLVRRYGTEDGVTGNLSAVTVGSAVNDAYNNYNLGACSLVTLAKNYAAAVRVVYNAVRSVSSSVAVALPFGGDFCAGMIASQTGSFDARSAMEAIAACLRDGGDIAWQVSYDIFPGEGRYAWEDTDPDLSSEAARVTAANLEVLLAFLAEETMLYDGAARTVTLLETEPKDSADENDRIRRSADYVFTWLRLSTREMRQITSYLPAHPVDYADTLTYIDTNRFTEVTAYAAELIGTERFASLVAAATVGGRYVSENEAVTVVPSAVKGETTVFSFEGGLDGWDNSLYCASVQGGIVLDEGARLRVRFAEAAGELWRGASVSLASPLDLSVAPYLCFNVRAAVLPAGVDAIELAVVVRSGDSYHRALLLLPADTDTTVIADLSDFPANLACDEIGIYVRGVDGEDIGQPTLLIGEIKAMSEEHSGKEIEEIIRQPDPLADKGKTVSLSTVITLSVLGLAALIAEGARLVLHYRRRDPDNDDNVG